MAPKTEAVAWPFAFGGEPTERLDWLTDVLAPRYGPPQTRKLRQSPRLAFEFDGLEQGSSRRWLEHLLAQNCAGRWHVPLVSDLTILEAGADIGATTLAVDTRWRRFTEGSTVMLVGDDPRSHELLVVDAVADGGLSLSAPLQRAIPAGYRVLPTAGGRLAAAPQLSRFTGDAVSYSIAFHLDEALDWPAALPASTYRDFPVLEIEAAWLSDPTQAHERDTEWVDNDFAPPLLFDRAGLPLPQLQFDVAIEGLEQRAEFRSLLYGLSGRWKPVWVPSLSHDVRVLALAGGAAIDVEWCGISDWLLQSNRRDLRFELEGADPIYRRIVSASAVDSSIERLVLDQPFAGDLAAVRRTSFMALCLQDSDVNLIRYWNHDTLLSELAFKAIPHEF